MKIDFKEFLNLFFFLQRSRYACLMIRNKCIFNELLNIDGSSIGYSLTRISEKLVKLTKIRFKRANQDCVGITSQFMVFIAFDITYLCYKRHPHGSRII